MPRRDPAYRLARVGDGAALRHALGVENDFMKSSETGRLIVAGLIDAAVFAPTLGADRLRALWSNPAKFQKHVDKRTAAGEIADAADYADKTFSVLAAATRITVVEPIDATMRVTGKVQLVADGWVVLLSEQGGIVTSHPFDPKHITFEARHTANGDKIHEHHISQEHRAALAKLFRIR